MGGIGTAIYRQAAGISARILAASPMVESVLLHRSVATGEISFGRSDIDMVLIVDAEKAQAGEQVARLYQAVKRARLFNPALNHIEVYDPPSLEGMARMDTFWASAERRSTIRLRGKPVEIPATRVERDHALGRFLLWVEWFFAIALQQRNRRNLRKTALECWNAFAVAEGLIAEPCLLRSEMEAQARRMEVNLKTEHLGDPAYAARFVFELGERLHRSRRRALAKLQGTLVFEAITAPLCLRRRFVVLPQADSALPPETFARGAFACTPEILHLFMHAKNAFFHWFMPRELTELGMQPPPVQGFLKACQYYGHPRFLLLPGFADPSPATQAARMELIRHAADHAIRGEAPAPVSAERVEKMTAGGKSVEEYYRAEYGPLRAESQRLQESLGPLLGADSRVEA